MPAPMSTKGWLSVGPDGRQRMTAEQKLAVMEAVRAIGQNFAQRNLTQAGISHFADMHVEGVRIMLDYYPDDRSCYTCDLERRGECLKADPSGGCEIPEHVLEQGCDSHQVVGAPF